MNPKNHLGLLKSHATNIGDPMNALVRNLAPTPVEGTVLVTPDMAAAWRKECHYGGQRVFKSWHCQNLVSLMKEHKFRKKTQIAFVRLGEKYYLTNGQHTLAAIELSGMTQVLSVVINDGLNMEDVADDFARHDTHLTRQFADSLVAHNVHEEFGITSTELHRITAAITYYCNLVNEISLRAQQLTHDTKLVLVRRHGRLAVQSLGYFTGSMAQSYLTRKTTLASAMFCSKTQPEQAEQFFRPLALDDGLRQGDPRKTLLDYLRSRSTIGGRYTNSTAIKSAADHELVKAISVAWNAWVEGRELKLIRVNFEAPTADFLTVGSLVVRGRKS